MNLQQQADQWYRICVRDFSIPPEQARVEREKKLRQLRAAARSSEIKIPALRMSNVLALALFFRWEGCFRSEVDWGVEHCFGFDWSVLYRWAASVDGVAAGMNEPGALELMSRKFSVCEAEMISHRRKLESEREKLREQNKKNHARRSR